MSCEAYRELLPAYLEDRLDEVRRTGFRAHLRTCAACRDHVGAEEPSLLLSLAVRRQPPREKVEACVTAVIAGIRQERLHQRLRPSRRPWLAAAAVVLLAVIAGAVWWTNGGFSGDAPVLQADALEVESPSQVEAEARLAEEPPPRVEVEMTQDEVRVYQYAIGDDGTTGAVFIVNPAMEL